MSADVESSVQAESGDARTSQGVAPSSRPEVDAAARQQFRRKALILFGTALAIRLIALWAASDAVLVKDEIAYLARAEALIDGEGYLGSYQSWVRHEGWRIMDLPQYSGAYQPPGYPTFSAAVLAVTGRSVVALKFVQCLLSALSCVLLFRIGRSWFGDTPGWIAGWLWALYPNSIAFSHLLWSETLFVFWLLVLVELLLGTGATAAPSRLPSVRRCLGAGVVLGLAALTRGTTVYLAPFLVGWMLLLAQATSGLAGLGSALSREGLMRAALVLGVALVCIAPWSIRNYGIHGGFVLIDTNAPYNLWRGNGLDAMALRDFAEAPRYTWPFESVLLHPVGNLNGRELVDAYRRDHAPQAQGEGPLMPTDLEVMAYATAASWDQILGDPLRTLRNAGHKLTDMWNPTSFLVRHLEMGAYGNVPGGLHVALIVAASGSYLVVMFFAAFGLVTGLADRRIWGVALLLVYFSAISALAFGLTRFRLPVMPLLMLVAAVELARMRQRSAAS
jgi:4-amino-4-deoxy-L-arabinose transferase-like glycosyltransferase